MCENDSETQQFLDNERLCAEENHYDVPKPIIIKTEENADQQQQQQQQEINNIPDVTFQMTPEIDQDDDTESKQQTKSIKDRMLLSTDDTSCLLFTQTITSPMLTPSEENIDFLKGFQRATEELTTTTTTPTDVVDKVEIEFAKTFTEPIYENVDLLNKEHIYENIADLKTTTESKTFDVTKQIISKFEENTNVATTNNSVVSVLCVVFFLIACRAACLLIWSKTVYFIPY